MKYIINYTDNNGARTRGWERDEYFCEEFDLENDREALRKVLEIQEQNDYDEFEEEFNDTPLEDLKNWACDIDTGFGSPVVFYVENENGERIYESGMDIEEWKSLGCECDDCDDEDFDDEEDC